MRSFRTVSCAVAVLVACGTAWAAEPSRSLDDYVVLGVRKAHLKNGAFVASGDVGLNDPGGSGLVIGRGCLFADGTNVVSDVTRADRVVVFNLFTNQLRAANPPPTVNGQGPLPTGTLPIIDPLPPLPPFAPGHTDVVVTGDTVLAPGAYRDVVVKNNGRLTFGAGTYQLASLKTGKNVVLLAAGPVTLQVRGNLVVGNASVIGPVPPLLAGDLVVNVGGTLARFGALAKATLHIYAPNASLAFGRSFQGIGRFVGRDIVTDHSTQFSGGVCGNGVVETGEQCDPPDGVACSATCRLIEPTTTTTTTTSTTTSTSATSTTAPSTTVPTTTTTTSTSTVPTTSTTASVPTTTTTVATTTTTTAVPTTTTTEPPATTTTTEPPTTTSTTTVPTTTIETTTTTSEPPATTTLETSTTTTTDPPVTTTTLWEPIAICGDGRVDYPEQCDPYEMAASCPPDMYCSSDCVCLFGGSS